MRNVKVHLDGEVVDATTRLGGGGAEQRHRLRRLPLAQHGLGSRERGSGPEECAREGGCGAPAALAGGAAGRRGERDAARGVGGGHGEISKKK